MLQGVGVLHIHMLVCTLDHLTEIILNEERSLFKAIAEALLPQQLFPLLPEKTEPQFCSGTTRRFKILLTHSYFFLSFLSVIAFELDIASVPTQYPEGHFQDITHLGSQLPVYEDMRWMKM